MNCPHCQSDTISPSGKCLECGHQVSLPAPTHISPPNIKETGSSAVLSESKEREGAQDSHPEEKIPQWRKDLSKRLQEIRSRKEATPGTSPTTPPGIKSTRSSIPHSRAQSSKSAPPDKSKLAARIPIRKTAAKPPTPVPRQKILQPLSQETIAVHHDAKSDHQQDVKNLIDNAVSRQSVPRISPSQPVTAAEITPAHPGNSEGKLILLSRTLSGLIDMICIVICTGSFILAADYFSGFIISDSISLVIFSALFLMNYFIYSLFFMAASSQTIGMMITDLRVVGIDKKRPSFTQLILRCCYHLVALLGLGIGLLWSLFNRENLCLHDQLSKTMVVRL